MATATVDSAASDHRLHSDSLPLIDIRYLSQSELLSLSFCSSSSSLRHLRNDTDVSTPKIDRSVFNESAGSRKQTFSRLRLAPPRNSSQFSDSSPIDASFHLQAPEQPLDEENSQIVSLLRSLFGSDSVSSEKSRGNDDNLLLVPVRSNECLGNASAESVPIGIADSSGGGEIKQPIPTSIADSGSRKRKRGRPRKNESDNQVVKCEIKPIFMQGNVEEKVSKVKDVENPYGEELRRRTEGMQSEEEILGYLQGLEGEWGSSRKKRRVVEASVFGDVLPGGWKLMLCVKKEAGRARLACRRYIRFLAVVYCYISSFCRAGVTMLDTTLTQTQINDNDTTRICLARV